MLPLIRVRLLSSIEEIGVRCRGVGCTVVALRTAGSFSVPGASRGIFCWTEITALLPVFSDITRISANLRMSWFLLNKVRYSTDSI
jgi:hypothetical protein